jgi:endonuclease/exonuclease/phosphatase family metal-dependent hydrolase/dipeptidyl aminopeptidase/acylaminoacyl peptidase
VSARRRLVAGLVAGSAALLGLAAPAAGQGLRVLTYNIQGNLNQDIDLGAIASVISSNNAPVVGLQEVCKQQVDDLVGRLRSAGWQYSQHHRTVTTTNANCREYGIALLSKLPLADPATTALPRHNEARVVQSATVTVGGLPVRVFNTHLSPGAGLTQTAGLAAELDKPAPERRVLLGDLNVQPSDTAALEPLYARSLTEADWATNTKTHPASGPTKKIDFVFFGGSVAGGATFVQNTQASDHRPLRADLTLTDPPDRGPARIVWSSTRSGGGDVLRAAPDGSALRRLTAHGAADTDPAPSPDGSRIAFTSTRDGDREIFVMDADGGNVRQLTHNTADDLEPAWSPDGTRIAFRSARTGNNEIFTMKADGTEQTNRTNNVQPSDFAPDWSPDGTKIVYQRYRAGSATGDGNEVFVMTATGGSPTNLTNTASGVNDGRPAWSPDGTRIAFHSNRSGDFELYTMTPTGGSVTRRTANPAADQWPAWSPDGTRLAFRSDRTGDTEIHVAEIGASGLVTSPGRTTRDPAADDAPRWVRDTRAPAATLGGGPSGAATREAAATFVLGTDEDEATFECRVGDGDWAACASPWTVALEEGTRAYAVRAVDWAGNRTATPASRTVRVDRTAPRTTIEAAAGGRFALAADEEGATFECAVDDGAFAPCAGVFDPAGLPAGEHVLRVRATDAVGNVEDPPATHAFTVEDDADPDPPGGDPPPPPGGDPPPPPGGDPPPPSGGDPPPPPGGDPPPPSGGDPPPPTGGNPPPASSPVDDSAPDPTPGWFAGTLFAPPTPLSGAPAPVSPVAVLAAPAAAPPRTPVPSVTRAASRTARATLPATGAVVADARGRVRLRIACPAGAGTCRGTLVLRGRGLTARRAIAVRAGARATVTVTLGRAARAALRRHRTLRVRAEVLAGPTVVARRTVVLRSRR